MRMRLLVLLCLLTGPVWAQTVNFEAVRVRPSTLDGQLAIELECRLTLEGLKGQPCELSVVFFDPQGQPLKDTDQLYYSASGEVAASVHFTPEFDSTLVDTLQTQGAVIRLPVSQLHLPAGSHHLRARMALYDKNRQTTVGMSNLATFQVVVP